ncbi:MAG: hypothetical protein AAFR87_21280 [Bacteroidota bacterium]
MKKSSIKIAIMAFLLIGLVGGCSLFFGTSDLRSETAKAGKDASKASQLLQEMARAHGVENWDGINSYQVRFEDEFLTFVGKSGSPFKQDKTEMLLSYIPGSFDGQLKFVSGKRADQTWGIQSWQTYTLDEAGEAVFKDNKDIKFWIPTYQYFVEFPKRILEADVLVYAGEREIEGISCEGVLASWKSVEPQKDIDQYQLWIDKESKRIVKMEYTIRELYGFLTGAAYFKDYKEYAGILLPSRLPVESNLQKEGFIHEMRILDFKADEIDPVILRPNQALNDMGTAKTE